ncbi:DHA2 family efflux MFS transporter permease subunit [Agrococcus sp. SGAir0287]|uniref:DHA2 family efflux MFS transporter permease subunit n=1 Tax=Agrococcus sp. SGAir0287 TaxID=2070347 RepID=UPI0010CCE8A0|nr:DHA2 family efflux MFS transporter permease subunit [Agrococcus sp. SGAir0287]QCR19146.1 MFS transporter [Agrococcus sp. SGAir0287]
MQHSTGSRARWLGLVAISLAVAIIIVDSTIVNVAIPSIVDDLGIGSTQVQWVQESYTLVFAALLLVFGALADRVGRRRMVLVGVLIFVAASILAASAPTGDLLIAARVVQGVGGAMILPTTLSLINAGFRGRDRGIAFAVWGSTIGGMAAVGPLLGGWLTTSFSWRWAFGVNVPIGALIVVGLLLFVAESRDADARGIDVVGALLAVVTTGTLVFGLIEGRSYGWWTATDAVPSWWAPSLSPVPIAFAVTLVAGGAFVWWGVRRDRLGLPAMLDVALLRIPSFRDGNVAAMIVALGEFGIILSLPLWLQGVLGYDALQTGLVLLALAIGSFVASGFAGAMGGRLSAVAIVRAGLVAEVVGLAAVALAIGPDASWIAIVPGLFVYGFGVGLATAQLTNVVLRDVPVALSGQGSGTQSTSRQIGSALGIALLGTILFTSASGILDARLAERSVPDEARQQIVATVVDSSGTAIPALAAQDAQAGEDARIAFSDATRLAALTAAGFVALGLLSTLRLRSRPADGEDSDAPAAREAPPA